MRALRAGPGYIEQFAESRSLFPNRRMIYMVPAWVNSSLMRPAVYHVKKIIQQHYSFGHFSDQLVWQRAQVFRRKRLTAIADDISGFDFSVARRHQQQLADELYAPLLERMGGDKSLYEYTLDMGVLSGSADTAFGQYLYDRRGMTQSGVISTSVDGTIINAARVIESVAAGMGWTVEVSFAKWLRGDWGMFIWGDDTMLFLPNGFNWDKYEAQCGILGYSVTREPGPVFLMVYHGDLRGPYNLGARAFMQTWFKERPTREPAHELVGTLARLSRILKAPDRDLILSLTIGASDWYKDRGADTFIGLERAAADAVSDVVPNSVPATLIQKLIYGYARGSDDLAENEDVLALVEGLGATHLLTGSSVSAEEMSDLRGVSRWGSPADFTTTTSVEGVDLPIAWAKMAERRYDEETVVQDVEPTDPW
jgi:hypothetical protein